MAAADVFGAEAHAASKSARKSMTSDGDVSACEKAREDGEAPPPGCTAFVRLELLKIPAEGAGATLAATAESDRFRNEAPPVSCPPGREWNGVTCVSPSAEAMCSRGNLAACKPKCEKKEGAACQVLSEHALSQKNDADARSYAEKACDYGQEKSCWWRGALAMKDQDDQTAVRWFSKGCSAGDPMSCSSAGVLHWKKLKDASKGFPLVKRGCDLGDKDGCDAVAVMYLQGEGTSKDGAKAVGIYEAQCKSGHVMSCERAAKEYEQGTNVKKDFAAAESLLAYACDNAELRVAGKTVDQRGVGCHLLAELYDRKKDTANAKKAWERACAAGSPNACRRTGKTPAGGGSTTASKKK
ncbi:MAG: sel1 repeat family protein [Polyangiaceae bacterium]|nr:sel1 repeat family protein [Polyangiaceae bacterium]